MAEQIRIQHELVTLRCAWHVSEGKPAVEVQLLAGRRHVSKTTVEAWDFGLADTLSVRTYRDARFLLPPGLHGILDLAAETLAEAACRCGAAVPLWLHLAQGSAPLSLYPWEQFLRQHPRLADVPVVRIPNFLRDPFTRRAQSEIVICASSPRAKARFSVADYIRRLIHGLSAASTGSGILHVFADIDAHRELPRAVGPFAVQVHDPSAFPFERVAPRSSSLAVQGPALQNPWMRWIAETLEGRPADAVHFICPGYFQEDRGALALAETPVRNTDSRWSRFVAVDELAALLDRLGAPVVGFSAPDEDVWAMGLRLLAFNLAWRRPGPIIVHDGGWETFDDVARNFAHLFGWEAGALPSLHTEYYCHPRLLVSLDDAAAGDPDTIREVSCDMLALASEPAEPSSDALTARRADADEDPWLVRIQRHLEIVRAGLSPIERGSRLAMLRREAEQQALSFVQEVLDRAVDERKSSSTSVPPPPMKSRE